MTATFRTYGWMLCLLLVFLSGCEVIGGIFEAGVWTGVLLVVLVVALLIWLIKKLVS